jgi:hypothetical protein
MRIRQHVYNLVVSSIPNHFLISYVSSHLSSTQLILFHFDTHRRLSSFNFHTPPEFSYPSVKMSDPTINGTDVFTPFWPGLNVTSLQNNVCYGDLNLCVNSDLYCNVSICDINTLANMKYVPVLGGNAFYAALFALVAIAQLGLGIKYKTWGFMTAAVLGNITEIIGYIGRIMMHNNIFAKNPFLIYLVCLTIAPAFLSASLYLCLARIVVLFGEHLSHLKPRTYTILFMVADFISLLLQAAGGAIASGSTDNNTVGYLHHY